jgi:hypothetical protein
VAGPAGAYGPADEAESIATLHCAVELGCTFLDEPVASTPSSLQSDARCHHRTINKWAKVDILSFHYAIVDRRAPRWRGPDFGGPV